MMATPDDLDESDVLCQKHKSKFNMGFRVQTANLTKKELENLYYTMLDANIELKKTVNAQTEQIKILNTKLYRFTTLQKNMITKEMSSNNFCCKSTKSLLEENKLSIVNLKKENQRLSERIRVLNMRLCSNKQFTVRQSPMQSLQTVRSTKIISSTPNEKKLSFLNVPMQSFIVQYAQTGTNTSTDDSEEPKEECSSHKCCTEMQTFKEDLENLQEELSKTQQEYVERIAKLEVEMIKLHNDYIKEKNEKKMTDLNLVNQMKDNKDLANRLKTAQLKCDELSMQLNSEKRRITELTTQIKAAQISDDVSKAIENHYAEKSEKLEPVIETLDEIKFDDRKNDAAPDPNVDLNDAQKDIATQWVNGKQRRKSSDSSKSIKSRRLSSSSKKYNPTKIPIAIKSTMKQNSNEKPSSPKHKKKNQADNPTVVETTDIPEKLTSKNQDTQSIIPQKDIAIGDDKKIIPSSNSEYDETEKQMDDFRVSNKSNNPSASAQYPVVQYDPALNKISSNTTITRRKSYGSDFPPIDDILIKEPVSENLIKIEKDISLTKNPDDNSYILKLDKGDNKGIPNNQQDYLPKEEKASDESYSQYFSDKEIASEINKDVQNLENQYIPQKLNEETNVENPSKVRSETKKSMNSISNIFNNMRNMLTSEKPKNENESNVNESVQVNESVLSVKSNVSRKSYSKRTQQESDELPVVENFKSTDDKDESLTSLPRKKTLASKSNVLNVINNGKEITSGSDNELEKGKNYSKHNRKTSTVSKSSKRSVKINPHASSRTRSGSLISLARKPSDKASDGKIEKFSGVTDVSIKSKASIQENKTDDTQEKSNLLLIGKPTYSVLSKVKNNNNSNKKTDIEIVDASQGSSPVLPTKTHATNTPHRIVKKDYRKSIEKTYNTPDLDNNTSKSRLISKSPINGTIVQRQVHSAEIVPKNNNDGKINTGLQSNVGKKPMDKNNRLAESHFSPRTDQENRSKMGPKIALNRSVSPRANQDSQSSVKPKISPFKNVSPRRDQESESFTRPKTPPNRSTSPRTDQKSQSITRSKTPPNGSVSSPSDLENQSLTRSKTPPSRSVTSRTDKDIQSLVKPKMSPNRNISPRREQESESITRLKIPSSRSASSRSDQENQSLTRSKTPPNRSVSSRTDKDSQSLVKPKMSPNRNISPGRNQESESFEKPKTPPSISSRANQDYQSVVSPNKNFSSRTDQKSESFTSSKTPPNRSVSPRANQNNLSVVEKQKILPNRNVSPRRNQENESFSRSRTPPNRSVTTRSDQENPNITRPKTSPSRSISTRQENQSSTEPKMSPNQNISPRRDQESDTFKRSKTPPNRSVSPRANQNNLSVVEKQKILPNRNVSPRRNQENESFSRSRTPPNRSVTTRSDQENPNITRPKTSPSRSISTRQENQSSTEPKMSPNQNISPRRDQESDTFKRSKTPPNRSIPSRTGQENQPLTRSKTPPNIGVLTSTDQESKSLTRPKTPPVKNKSRTGQDGQFLLKPKMSPNRNASLRKDQESSSLIRSKTTPNRSGSPRTDQESQSLARPKTPPAKSAYPRTYQENQFLNPKISSNKKISPRVDQESQSLIRPKISSRNISPRTDQSSKPLARPVSTSKKALLRTNQEIESIMRPNIPPNRNGSVTNNRRQLVQSTPQKFKLLTDNNSSKNMLRKTKPLSERSMIKKVVMRPQPIRRPVTNASLNTSPVNENIPMSSVPHNEYGNNDSGFGDDRNQNVEKLNNEDLLNMIFSLQNQLDELRSITADMKKNSVTPEPEVTPVPEVSPKRNEITVPVLRNVKDYDCIVIDPKENVILDIKHVNQEDQNDNLQQTPQPDPFAYDQVNSERPNMTESFYNPTEQNNVASSSNGPPFTKKQFDFNNVLPEQELLKNPKSPNKAKIKSKIISETFPENSRTATGQGPFKMARERTFQDLPKNYSKIKSKHHENVENNLREKMSPDEYEKADQKITAAEKERQIIGKLPRYFSGTSLWDQKRPRHFLPPPIKNDNSINNKEMADEDKPEPKPPPPPVDGNTVPFPVNQEKYLKNAANWMEDKKEQKKGEGGAGGGAGQRTGQSSRGGETSKIHHEEQQEPDLCAHFIKICRCPKTPRKDVELFRTCSGTLRFKAYDPASGGFRRCECSKNDREGGPRGGQDNETGGININSNRFAINPSPVSGATENDISSTAMNSRHTRSNLGNRSSSGEYDSTYSRSFTPPLSPYDQISEGEVKSAGERGTVKTSANAPQSTNEKMSQNMEMTLQKITEELAKCNRLLMYQKNNPECPTSLTRNASVQVRGVSMTSEGTKRSESLVVSFVPKCVFTIYIGSMVLSDEAVLQGSVLNLVLMWKYYDQTVAMTEITPGRKIQLHSSSTYDVKLSDEFFDYMRKKEMKIVLCELNDQERIFGYCYLPLRDALINTNRRVDMSLALIAGPRLVLNTPNPEFEIGVIDLWCHLQVQQKFMPFFNEAISKKSNFAQGTRGTIDNLNNTMLPQYVKNKKRDSDVVCSEDLEILSESKRKRWIQQNDMKKFGRRMSDSSSDTRVGTGLKSNNTAMLQEGLRGPRDPLGKETTDRDSGNTYNNKTTSTRNVSKSLYHRNMDYNYDELMDTRRSDISSNLGLLRERPEENNHLLANEVPTKVKTLRELEAIVEQGNQRDSISTSIKINEYPLQNLNEQWKYYDQLPERDAVDVEKALKHKKSVTIEDAKQIKLKGEVFSEIVDITILWLALNEESDAMNDKTIHRLFIAYSFLGYSGAECETPMSLTKPKHQLDKCHFNFQKTFMVTTPMDYRLVGHLGKCFQRNQYEHNPKDCITFSVVSEPYEDPLGLANCEDIGHAYLYLGDLLQFSAGSDTYTEVLPIMCVKDPATVMGVLSVKVDGLNFVRYCTRLIM